MSRTTTLPPKAPACHAIAVAGPDLDPSLVAKLTVGDRVLVEVNGTRIFSDSACPLVAEVPWKVVENDPPQLGQRPEPRHKIVLSHSQSLDLLELHYVNLIHTAPKQPAVFYERRARFNPTEQPQPVYVILQLVSHFIPATDVDFVYEPYDKESASLVLTDETLRAAVIAEWVSAIEHFKHRDDNDRKAWEHRSVYRLAMRAFVNPSVILAFKEEDWEALGRLSVETLGKIHEAMHWMPHFLEQSRLAVVRDTKAFPSGEDAEVSDL